MKKWIIALLFVFACLPVIAIKAAPPQTYIHLDYEVIEGYYDIDNGNIELIPGWHCSNKIQIPKNVDKLYFRGWLPHFILFFNETYIGYYYEGEYVLDLTWTIGAEEKILGVYYSADSLTHVIDVPAGSYVALQTCKYPTEVGLEDYIIRMPYELTGPARPLIYYPAPTDAAAIISFGLMPMLMIVIAIAGLTGGLIMITKKSKR